MADKPNQPDQFGKNADATEGGGASTDRGGRDAGTPGPATGASKRPDEATQHPKPMPPSGPAARHAD